MIQPPSYPAKVVDAAKRIYGMRRGLALAKGDHPHYWPEWDRLSEVERETILFDAYYIHRNAALPEDVHKHSGSEKDWVSLSRSEKWETEAFWLLTKAFLEDD